MEPAEQQASDILAAVGCRVSEIPEADERRADLWAVDTSSSYLIEVKHKLDDIELLRDHAKRMLNGEVVSRCEPTSRNNTVDAILRDAQHQLEQTPQPSDSFRLIWFHAGGIDSDLHWKRAFATFYGYVQLLALEPAGSEIVGCFYFDFSAAWAMRSVDAMILSNRDDLQLCLNEFSQRREDFKCTNLYKCLSIAAVDPQALVTSSKSLALYSDVSRKDENLALTALQSQTGVRYTTLRPKQYSASVKVERETAGQTEDNP